MKFYLLTLPALLIACGEPEKDVAVDDTGDTQTTSCTFEVTSTSPNPGATDAYYRGVVRFVLNETDSSATVTAPVAGTQTVAADGKTVVFTPDAPLTPSTPYTFSLDYCNGEKASETSFTTSALGTPVPDTSALVGNTYALNLAEADIVEPPGIGAVLATYLTTSILAGVTAVDSSSIQMMGAVAVKGGTNQDYCDPSIPFPSADFTDQPFFSIGPEDTTLVVAGLEINIEALNITGSFAADGSYFAGGTLSGTIDTRPLSILVDDSGENPGAICELAVNFGAECETCPVDGEPYCLTLVAENIVAEQVSGVVVEVLGNNCEGCDVGPPAPDAVCEG